MTGVQQLRSNLQALVERYFPGYTVRWTNEKYVKPTPPFITLRMGQVHISEHPIVSIRGGAEFLSHPSTAKVELNIYSPGLQSAGAVPSGAPAKSQTSWGGNQNSACDELTGFCISLGYPSTRRVLFEQDFNLNLAGDVLDVSAILDGIEPEFRAMAEFDVDFTIGVEDPYAHDGTDGAAGGDIDATGYFTEVERPEFLQEE